MLDAQLWSGSIDHSIRVWDVGSGRCLGVLKGSTTGGVQSGFGHTDAVSCLELIPAATSSNPTDSTGGEAYIASGGGDGEVKLWRPNGEYVHSCSHGAFVTALKFFQDTYGGKSIVDYSYSDTFLFINYYYYFYSIFL